MFWTFRRILIFSVLFFLSISACTKDTISGPGTNPSLPINAEGTLGKSNPGFISDASKIKSQRTANALSISAAAGAVVAGSTPMTELKAVVWNTSFYQIKTLSETKQQSVTLTAGHLLGSFNIFKDGSFQGQFDNAALSEEAIVIFITNKSDSQEIFTAASANTPTAAYVGVPQVGGASTFIAITNTVYSTRFSRTWQSGSSQKEQPNATAPGARDEAVSWEENGNIWIFGGTGVDSASQTGKLNDLWKFNGTNWNLVKGDSLKGQFGSYGIQGNASATNKPGARRAAFSWANKTGTVLWLFGGTGLTDTVSGNLGDLWKFDGTNWTWAKGLSTTGESPNYGIRGASASANTPGARREGCAARDSQGNFWLFGGMSEAGTRNDLWKFSPTTEQWTWVSGSNLVAQVGDYGTKSVTLATNVPGARAKCNLFVDSQGSVLLRGGHIYDNVASPNDSQRLADLWKFDGTNWTWISGENTLNVPTNSGSMGLTASTNTPGGRLSSTGWIDALDNIYLFGGTGMDDLGSQDEMNDLWKFDGTSWTWIAGSKNTFQPGVYGTPGIFASTNMPGSRRYSTSWTDANGDFWLFGGFGNDSVQITANSQGRLNDLWKFSLH